MIDLYTTDELISGAMWVVLFTVLPALAVCLVSACMKEPK